MPSEGEEPPPGSGGGGQARRMRPSKKKRSSKRGALGGAGAKAAGNKKAKAEKQEKELMLELMEKGAQAAKEYLQLWALREEGGGWRFQKKRQVFLLKHMYNKAAFDKKTFKKYVLPYVGSLQGGAKERVLAEAKGYLGKGVSATKEVDEGDSEASDNDEADEVGDAGGAEENEEATKLRKKRAEKIVEALEGGSVEDQED